MTFSFSSERCRQRIILIIGPSGICRSWIEAPLGQEWFLLRLWAGKAEMAALFRDLSALLLRDQTWHKSRLVAADFLWVEVTHLLWYIHQGGHHL